MPRPMLRVPPRKYYYSPYKTQCLGFNTEFSVEDLRNKVRFDKPLDDDEQTFVNYLKIKELW